jgi:putative ABC transport system substrate-binding protein
MQLSHEIAAKQLSLLRELAPSAKRVAIMFEAGNPSMMQAMRTVERASDTVGLKVLPVPLRGWQDVDAALVSWLREPVGGLLVLYDRVTSNLASNIASLARRLNLPAIFGHRSFLVQGGLVSYGIDWAAQIESSADYVARVLDGAKPADLPVQQPTRFELIVNLSLARIYGVTMPQSVLLQATEVIR